MGYLGSPRGLRSLRMQQTRCLMAFPKVPHTGSKTNRRDRSSEGRDVRAPGAFLAFFFFLARGAGGPGGGRRPREARPAGLAGGPSPPARNGGNDRGPPARPDAPPRARRVPERLRSGPRSGRILAPEGGTKSLKVPRSGCLTTGFRSGRAPDTRTRLTRRTRSVAEREPLGRDWAHSRPGAPPDPDADCWQAGGGRRSPPSDALAWSTPTMGSGPGVFLCVNPCQRGGEPMRRIPAAGIRPVFGA